MVQIQEVCAEENEQVHQSLDRSLNHLCLALVNYHFIFGANLVRKYL